MYKGECSRNTELSGTLPLGVVRHTTTPRVRRCAGLFGELSGIYVQSRDKADVRVAMILRHSLTEVQTRTLGRSPQGYFAAKRDTAEKRVDGGSISVRPPLKRL